MKIGSINEDKFWLIAYLYISLALIGIFFSGSVITPSYYTLIFLGIVPFLFLYLNKRIVMGNVKKSFLYHFYSLLRLSLSMYCVNMAQNF